MSAGASPLLVIDARRGDAVLLAKTLTEAPPSHEIWVWSFEPINDSKRITTWILADDQTPIESRLHHQNKFRSVVVAHAGITSLPTRENSSTPRFHEVHPGSKSAWTGWIYVPRDFLEAMSATRVRRLIEGGLERNETRSPSTLPARALHRKRALLVAHKDFDGLRDEIEKLEKGHLVFLMLPGRDGFSLRAFHGGRSFDSLVPFDWGARSDLNNPPAEKAFREFLKRVRPDVIHFHQLLDYPYRLVEIAKNTKTTTTKTTVFFHDYYAFSPRANLIDAKGNYVGFLDGEPADRRRRKEIRKILHGVPKVVAAAETKRLLVEHLKLIASEITVEDESRVRGTAPFHNPRPQRRGTLSIAFVGAFNRRNGSKSFEHLVKTFAPKSPELRWLVLGEINESALALDLMESHGVEFFGACDRERRKYLLQREGVDIALILPIWPETSKAAVFDAIDADCLPLVSNLGAPAEAVRSLGQGAILRAESLEEGFLQAIRTFSPAIPIEPTSSMRNTPTLNA
ncbi:MAG: hypothetical protein AAB250_08445 [Bdellovibrionota bacterium]